MTQYQPSKRVVRKRKDADRQQVRRNGMKASGTPTTHVLNRAIVEGLMYQIDLQRARGVAVKDMQIPAQRILAYATSILTAQTNGGDRYAVESVVGTIRDRIGQPDARKYHLTFLRKEQRRGKELMALRYAEEVEE
ncbi:hypothetical protein NIM87_05985 [Devosia sp. XJ19-1]|uniref:Uncharacterized protein n=1 Tax=Devosia ureilytica TaxID=2952754 RepID=A0A9Q4AMW1_9HYPH|nr:hypothetical protein [Devosia ureilytica]MCP8883042.1 hypothetical protein [Devosia ureilytica]MCP8886590.1 hypothetical protein [Devosia ureilytica]